jgi:hypothetical protein
MTPLTKATIAGPVTLGVAWAAMSLAPPTWDLLFLIVAASAPLWFGLIALGDGLRQCSRGPRRAETVVAIVVGFSVVLFSGRVLLGIFGWH